MLPIEKINWLNYESRESHGWAQTCQARAPALHIYMSSYTLYWPDLSRDSQPCPLSGRGCADPTLASLGVSRGMSSQVTSSLPRVHMSLMETDLPRDFSVAVVQSLTGDQAPPQ